MRTYLRIEMRDVYAVQRGLSRRQFLGGVGGVAVLGVAGCLSAPTNPGTQTTAGGGGTTVETTLSDYAIELSRTTVPSGSVTFEIRNVAEQEHEFVVFDTDLQAGNLPTTEDGNEVSEDAGGLTVVDEVEDIAGGEGATLTVDLTPGRYVAICNLPGHYKLGMYVGFTVQ